MPPASPKVLAGASDAGTRARVPCFTDDRDVSAAAFACWAAILVRDRTSLESASVEAETMGREYGFGFPAGAGAFARGLLLNITGEDEGEGLRTMTETMRLFEKSGYMVVLPSLMAVVAEAHLTQGEVAPARALVAEANALTAGSGDRRHLAELARIEGQAELVSGDPVRARRRLEEAKSIAHSLQQKWHELRASLALARLLESEGEAREARGVLEPVVAAIQEGEDLPELREARSMLRRPA